MPRKRSRKSWRPTRTKPHPSGAVAFFDFAERLDALRAANVVQWDASTEMLVEQYLEFPLDSPETNRLVGGEAVLALSRKDLEGLVDFEGHLYEKHLDWGTDEEFAALVADLKSYVHDEPRAGAEFVWREEQ